MATKRYTGNALAVAQVASGSIDSVDGTPANNTFTVTIGGVAVSVVGNTSAAQTAADLVAALNLSTHPYFAAITWANPSAGNITATADVAGVPFEAALTETGAGSGAVTDFSNDTDCEGPAVLDSPGNYSDGSIPANGDTLIFADSDQDVAYNLDALSGVGLAALIVEQTYTGLLGLPASSFATNAAPATSPDDSVPEYRETYLTLGADLIEIGDHNAVNIPNGARRLKIDNNEAGASQTIIYNTAPVGIDANLPAVRLLANNAGADVEIRAAAGGVGFAVENAAETATFGDLTVADESGAARVFVGAGVTFTNWVQHSGRHVVRSAAAITAAEVEGGELVLRGDQAVTTLTINAGSVRAENEPSAGNALGTVNLNGGTLSGLGASIARTWGTVNHEGGRLERDSSHVTISTYTPPTGRGAIDVARA